VIITDKAKDRIKVLKLESNLDKTYFLRVSVQGGGCSGLSYKLDFDNTIKSGDQEFEDNGEKLVLDMKSILYLAGPSQLWYLPSQTYAIVPSALVNFLVGSNFLFSI